MEKFPEFVANHLFLFSLLLSIIILLLWNFFGNTISGVKAIATDEVTRLINREDAKVVDLRSQGDFEKGHIIDAINISPDQLENQRNKLNKFKDNGIILCCGSGSVSAREAKKLMQEGFEKIYYLKGGILSWQNANLPLTRGHK